MKRVRSCLLLAYSLALLYPGYCLAQQDTTAPRPVKMILKDGSEFYGTVVKEDSASVNFRTAGDLEITVPWNKVKSIERLSGRIAGGEYVRPDPNYTRLLFAPTARPLKSGQGYFSAYEVFFPFLAMGVGDIVTLAGGMSLFPFVNNQLVYLAPKITPINTKEISAAAGVLYINATSGGGDGVGIIYGVTTLGSTERAATAGLGWGFYGDEIADEPVLMLGGELRASNSIKFVSENWFPPESDLSFLSLGIRFFGDKLAADLALIYPAGAGIEGFPFIPWLGFAYNFGIPEQPREAKIEALQKAPAPEPKEKPEAAEVEKRQQREKQLEAEVIKQQEMDQRAVTDPVPLSVARAEYPEAAREAGAAGKVFVRVTVGTDGVPRSAEVLKGIGSGCDEAAKDAALRSTFRPGTDHGQPAEKPFTMIYIFP